jgi:carbon starvation protein
MPIMLGVLACLAVAYRYYSAFLAARVAALDDSRRTPAHELYDGQNYHPTNRWVLFGHHFAAISGAGPLIGPVLAIQFGYLPGLIWIVVGVCLAGAVQDMLVLAASVRRGGRSLAEIARTEINRTAGVTASVVILFVVIIALSGLGVVVVKALGGELIQLSAGTRLHLPEGIDVRSLSGDAETGRWTIPGGTKLEFAQGDALPRSESFTVIWPADQSIEDATHPGVDGGQTLELPAGVVQSVPGSSWGAFTIACTIPIALLVGWYMYRIRKGRVVEASLIGAAATIGATIIGNWIPGSSWDPYFSLSRGEIIWAIAIYGFIASVLPVWLLLCPRDYLSSFLKIGTVVLLVGSVILANPRMEAPAVNPHFAGGGGPYFSGAIFPFCFICIMCGAISGFHALVSSGTTPKMISREGDVRMIGYGAMLIEGLVGIVALISAATLPQADYWAINIRLDAVPKYASTLEAMNATGDNLAAIENQVGGEALRGRTGGAVTLAVGMSQIFSSATQRVFGNWVDIDGAIKYWYHFAIMFEALFILTTIDTGTRIARFLLQEIWGKFDRRFERTDWIPGSVISSAIVVFAWAGLIATGSIETIWPMFGIANQLLAVLALCVITSVIVNSGRGRYVWVTLVPMAFVLTTTTTAGIQLVAGKFRADFVRSWTGGEVSGMLISGLNIALTVFMLVCLFIILGNGLGNWLDALRRNRLTRST